MGAAALRAISTWREADYQASDNYIDSCVSAVEKRSSADAEEGGRAKQAKMRVVVGQE